MRVIMEVGWSAASSGFAPNPSPAQRL